MTTRTRRTEMEIKTHEITVIRSRSKQDLGYCERCKTIATEAEQSAERQETPEELIRLVESLRNEP